MSIPTFTPGIAPSQYQLDWWNYSRPLMQAVSTTGMSLTTGAATYHTMTSILVDRGAAMNIGTGQYSLGGLLGYYWVEGFVNFGTNTSGYSRTVEIFGQFTQYGYSTGAIRAISNGGIGTGRTLLRATTPSDYVGLYVKQNSGGTITSAFAALYVEYAGR
jgi:hypothetical protein